MKHIGKTNENEVIISLKMQDINTLMMLTNSATLHYTRKMENNPNAEGVKIMFEESIEWWSKLYELRETI